MIQKIFQCPKCGSGAVEFPVLIGTPAKCQACAWQGHKDELVQRPVNTPFSGKEEAADGFAKEIFYLMAQELSLPLGRLLLRWGLIPIADPAQTKEDIVRILRAASQAMGTAILQELVAIEQDRVRRAS